MEPIFGVMGMYEIARNDQGELDGDLYMERVASMGKKHGFVPTSLTLSPRHFGDRAKDKGFVRELKAKLGEMQLKPLTFCGMIYLSPKPWEQEESLKRAIKGLEFVAEIGANAAMFGPRWHGRVAREGRMRIAIDLCRRLADAAKDHGLHVGMEDYEYWIGDDFEMIFNYCDRDNLGIINDTGNWLITGEDPLMQTLRFRDRIVGVHLKDYRREMGYWHSVALGTGMVDMKRVIEAMWDLPKPYPILMPVETDLDGGSEFEAQEESLAFLRKIVDEIKSEKA
jgi:sugar phosphate isomerase/epimerase